MKIINKIILFLVFFVFIMISLIIFLYFKYPITAEIIDIPKQFIIGGKG